MDKHGPWPAELKGEGRGGGRDSLRRGGPPFYREGLRRLPFPAAKGEGPQPLARSREGPGSRLFPLLGCASGNREGGGRRGECGGRVAAALS